MTCVTLHAHAVPSFGLPLLLFEPAHNPQQYHPGKTRDRACSEPGFFPGGGQTAVTPGMRTRVSNPGIYQGRPISRAFQPHNTTREKPGKGQEPGFFPGGGQTAVTPGMRTPGYTREGPHPGLFLAFGPPLPSPGHGTRRQAGHSTGHVGMCVRP